jgi:hypothetical protein
MFLVLLSQEIRIRTTIVKVSIIFIYCSLMVANGLAMPSCGVLFGTMCSVWNAQSHSCVYGLNLQNDDQKHS